MCPSVCLLGLYSLVEWLRRPTQQPRQLYMRTPTWPSSRSAPAGLAAMLPAGAAFCRAGAGRGAELARRGARAALIVDYKRKRREALRRAAGGKRPRV